METVEKQKTTCSDALAAFEVLLEFAESASDEEIRSTSQFGLVAIERIAKGLILEI